MNARKRLLFSAGLVVFAAILFEISSAVVVHVVTWLRPNLAVESTIRNHFDTVTEAYREKFVSSYHDSERGWDYRPNTEQTLRNSIGEEWHASIDSLGARHHPSSADGQTTRPRPLVATYGDSFTRSAEVEDDETWQFFLERESGCGVLNFGVGGYGTGQALLKFEAHLDAGRSSPVSLLGIHASNLARVGNAFRPFVNSSTGMKLGFKPAFRPDGSGGLRIFENPYRDPDASLADLEGFAADAARYDAWTEGRARLEFPYVLQLFRIARSLIERAASDSVEVWEDAEETSVMLAIIDRFVERANSVDSTPVVLLFPSGGSLREGGAPRYAGFLSDLRAARPGLHVIDLAGQEFDRERLQIQPFRGHLSPYGNRIVAAVLHDWLKENVAGLASRCGGT